MMRIQGILLVLLMIVSLPISAQNEETRQLDQFKGVKTSASIQVIAEKGNRNMIKIESEGEASKIKTEISDGTLTIYREKESMWSWNTSNEKVTCYLTYADELEYLRASSSARLDILSSIQADELEVRASSSGKIVFKNATIQELEIDVSSSGKVEGSVNATYAEFDVSSSGKIYLDGSVTKLEAEASSSGKISASDLIVKELEASASSSGKVMVTVTDKVDAKASSSGKVYFNGNPRIMNTDTSSGGRVQRM